MEEQEEQEEKAAPQEDINEFEGMSLVKKKGRSRGFYLLKRGVILQPAPTLVDAQTSANPIMRGVKRRRTLPIDTQRPKRRKVTASRRKKRTTKSRRRVATKGRRKVTSRRKKSRTPAKRKKPRRGTKTAAQRRRKKATIF